MNRSAFEKYRNSRKRLFSEVSSDTTDMIKKIIQVYQKHYKVKLRKTNLKLEYSPEHGVVVMDNYVQRIRACIPKDECTVELYNGKDVKNIPMETFRRPIVFKNDILYSILKYCEKKDLLEFKLVNKQWYNVINTYVCLWEPISQKDFIQLYLYNIKISQLYDLVLKDSDKYFQPLIHVEFMVYGKIKLWDNHGVRYEMTRTYISKGNEIITPDQFLYEYREKIKCML